MSSPFYVDLCILLKCLKPIYACLYDFSAFRHDEKSAKLNFGVDLGRVPLCLPLLWIHTSIFHEMSTEQFESFDCLLYCTVCTTRGVRIVVASGLSWLPFRVTTFADWKLCAKQTIKWQMASPSAWVLELDSCSCLEIRFICPFHLNAPLNRWNMVVFCNNKHINVSHMPCVRIMGNPNHIAKATWNLNGFEQNFKYIKTQLFLSSTQNFVRIRLMV